VLVVATRNAGKTVEFERLLEGLALRLESLRGHPQAPEVEENGATYAENALAKARSAAAACGLPALADDSGLRSTRSAGGPAYSARYAAAASENVRLSSELCDVPAVARTRFRCVVARLAGRPRVAGRGHL
jgi:XTP/dITP diphosphohydrolase